MTHRGAAYAGVYERAWPRVVDLARRLGAEHGSQLVPATPRWTVRQVLAHLAGVGADGIAGRMDGAPGEAWTARHVAERDDRSVAELADEIERNAPFLVAALAGGQAGPPLAVDLLSHEQDLRSVCGVGIVDDAEAWGVTGGFFARRLVERVEADGLPPLRVVVDGAAVGPDDVAATWTASGFAVTRARAGRRSARQVVAQGWQGDPSPYLPVLNVFGPLPDADVVD